MVDYPVILFLFWILQMRNCSRTNFYESDMTFGNPVECYIKFIKLVGIISPRSDEVRKRGLVIWVPSVRASVRPSVRASGVISWTWFDSFSSNLVQSQVIVVG